MRERMTKIRAVKTPKPAPQMSKGVAPETPPASAIAATTQAIELTGGRYLVQHLGIDGTSTTLAGRVYPFAILFAPDRKSNTNLLRFLGTDGGGLARLLTPGDRTIVEVTGSGKTVFFSVFNAAGTQSGVRLGIKRLQSDESAAASSPIVQTAVHLQDIGDQRATGSGWVGLRDSRLRLEGFALSVAGVKGGDIEYFANNGGPSPQWVGSGRFAGTKGRALPVTRFAVRLTGELDRSFSVIYQGHYSQSGETKVFRNGEVCGGTSKADFLLALRVGLVARDAPAHFPFSPALQRVQSSDVVEVNDLIAGAARADAMRQAAAGSGGGHATADAGSAPLLGNSHDKTKTPAKARSQSKPLPAPKASRPKR